MHILTGIPAATPSRWLDVLRSEITLYWKFNRYDISATVMPGMLFVLAAWHSQNPDWAALPGLIVWGTIYFWLYCTTFCISNQLAGEVEDRLNKPDRPLPSGLVSRRGAFVRWIIAMVLFAAVGWWLGVLEWTLLWQVTLTLHNFAQLARHYLVQEPLDGIWGDCATGRSLADGTAIDPRSVELAPCTCHHPAVARIIAGLARYGR